MARHSLTDEQWEMIEDLFPARKPTGRPRMDHRAAFDAIIWILRTGAPWRDLPSEMGNWRTVYGHYDQWSGDGTLDAVLDRLRTAHIDGEVIDHDLWCVDSSVVRTQRCAVGGGKKGIPTSRLTMP